MTEDLKAVIVSLVVEEQVFDRLLAELERAEKQGLPIKVGSTWTRIGEVIA